MKNKIRGPQQTQVLDRDVLVLRKINFKKLDPGIYDLLADTQLEPDVKEEQMPWFDEGYVANDHPRDAMISAAIIKVTKGFVVARTDNGDILHDFGMDLAAADKAVQNAKVKLDIDVTLEPDAEDEDEDEDLTPEGEEPQS